MCDYEANASQVNCGVNCGSAIGSGVPYIGLTSMKKSSIGDKIVKAISDKNRKKDKTEYEVLRDKIFEVTENWETALEVLIKEIEFLQGYIRGLQSQVDNHQQQINDLKFQPLKKAK